MENDAIPFDIENETNKNCIYDTKLIVYKYDLEKLIKTEQDESKIQKLRFILDYIFSNNYINEKREVIKNRMIYNLSVEDIDVNYAVLIRDEDNESELFSLVINFNKN